MFEDVIIMPFKNGSIPIAIPSIGKTFANANYKINKPYEDNYTFELVISGKGYVKTESGLKCVKAGDLFISRPYIPRLYYADQNDPFEKLWFIVIGDLPDSILKNYEIYETVYHAPDCLPIFENLYNEAKNNRNYQSICSLGAKAILKIADLLYFSKIAKSKIPEYLTITKAFIDERYTENLTVEQLSEVSHVSPSQLTRAFKKYYKATPYEYLLNLKIEAAKTLLSTTILSVKQIAFNLGFCDEHYFSSLFKKKVGLSPSKYGL